MIRTALFAFALLGITASQALACSPSLEPAPTLQEKAARADTVFVVQIRSVTKEGRRGIASYDLRVDTVLAGALPEKLTAWTYTESSACGFVLKPGYYVLYGTASSMERSGGYTGGRKGWHIQHGQSRGPSSRTAALEFARTFHALM